MPIIQLAAFVVCSTCAGFLIGRSPSLPDYMTREADTPVRARVMGLRRGFTRSWQTKPEIH